MAGGIEATDRPPGNGWNREDRERECLVDGLPADGNQEYLDDPARQLAGSAAFRDAGRRGKNAPLPSIQRVAG